MLSTRVGCGLLLIFFATIATAYDYSGLPLTIWHKSKPSSRVAAEGAETYGYVDRYPSAERPNPRYAFGVPHRFADVKSQLSDSADYSFYPSNFHSMRSSFPSLNKRARANEWDPWAYDDEESVGEYDSDFYQSGPDPQDVINFERYVQKYFDDKPDDFSSQEKLDADEVWSSQLVDTSKIRNDEVAASQLHSLISSRKPSPLSKILGLGHLAPLQKKSSAQAAAISTTTTTTVAPATTASAVKVTKQGQKEEALLRPPSPSRMVSATQEPPKQQEEEGDRKSIYDTIKRLFEMHCKLEEASGTDEQSLNPRMKRFVSGEDSLFRKARGFDKTRV